MIFPCPRFLTLWSWPSSTSLGPLWSRRRRTLAQGHYGLPCAVTVCDRSEARGAPGERRTHAITPAFSRSSKLIFATEERGSAFRSARYESVLFLPCLATWLDALGRRFDCVHLNFHALPFLPSPRPA